MENEKNQKGISRGKYFAYYKLPVIFMGIIAFTQILLSIIGIISLGSLLFFREQVVAGFVQEESAANQQILEEIHSLTPPFILSSMFLLICGFVLSLIILRQAWKYRKKHAISILPLSFFIMVHLAGVFSDVIREKEDPLGFSIIGVLLLFCITSMYLVSVASRSFSLAEAKEYEQQMKAKGDGILLKQNMLKKEQKV
ncbi:hypothetical protein ACYSNW_13565 [Enterococcus sp. LJL99]